MSAGVELLFDVSWHWSRACAWKYSWPRWILPFNWHLDFPKIQVSIKNWVPIFEASIILACNTLSSNNNIIRHAIQWQHMSFFISPCSHKPSKSPYFYGLGLFKDGKTEIDKRRETQCLLQCNRVWNYFSNISNIGIDCCGRLLDHFSSIGGRGSVCCVKILNKMIKY